MLHTVYNLWESLHTRPSVSPPGNIPHRKHVIEQEKQWDFLKDLTAKVADVGKGEGQEGAAPRRGR